MKNEMSAEEAKQLNEEIPVKEYINSELEGK